MSSNLQTKIVAMAVCCCFMLVGPSLIMLNQYILKSLNFPYPIFLSGLGVLASGLFARVLVFFGFAEIHRTEAIEGILWYKRILPVGLTSALTLSCGNMAYLYLDVGLIQMLKSFTPVVIMFTGYMTGIDHPTLPVTISTIIISLGTATTCTFAPSLQLMGMMIQFGAELTEGIKLVFTQLLLHQLKFSIIEGQYVLAPASAFWLFLFSLIFEFRTMIEKDAFSILFNKLPYFLAASSMGIAVNFLSYSVIQYTSSLTMKILAMVRNISMVIVGVMYYNEIITYNSAIGYFIATIGFLGYNFSKMGYFDENSYLMTEIRGMIDPESVEMNKKREDEDLIALLPRNSENKV